MSRVLAELLGVNEPSFRLRLQQWERAAGHPSADIRLAADIALETKHKLRLLELDPHNTTGAELYAALRLRLLADEHRVRQALQLPPNAPPEAVMRAVVTYAEQYAKTVEVFALKPAHLRKIIKTLAPKATMKALGYRSMDSMFKHEPILQLLAATYIAESADWHAQRLKAYTTLRPSDFETRPMQYLMPAGKKWPQLGERFVTTRRHTMLAFAEMGGVTVLPLTRDLPGLAIASLGLCLQAVNDIRSVGAYLKLQQVRADFGSLVARSVRGELAFEGILPGEALPWKSAHWLYGRGHAEYPADVFEPHMHASDLTWHAMEGALAQIHPALAFWQNSHILGLLDGHDTVSLNVLDVALSVCNGLAYGEHLVHHLRQAMRHELHARYLRETPLHTLFAERLGDQLIADAAI